VATGAWGPSAGLEVLRVGGAALRGSAILIGTAILDALMLMVLMRWRPSEDTRPAATQPQVEKLPEYDETEVQNFH